MLQGLDREEEQKDRREGCSKSDVNQGLTSSEITRRWEQCEASAGASSNFIGRGSQGERESHTELSTYFRFLLSWVNLGLIHSAGLQILKTPIPV